MCLSGGMTTRVQGVHHSLKRKQKDEDYEMQPQPEVAYYQSCELRMSSLHKSNLQENIHADINIAFKYAYTYIPIVGILC